MSTSFEDRIAKLEANKPAPAPRAQPRPAPKAPKSGIPFIGLGIPATIIAVGIVIFTLNFERSGLAADPFVALEENRKGDTAFEKCVNDLQFQAELKAQGHANPRFAAMLMCG